MRATAAYRSATNAPPYNRDPAATSGSMSASMISAPIAAHRSTAAVKAGPASADSSASKSGTGIQELDAGPPPAAHPRARRGCESSAWVTFAMTRRTDVACAAVAANTLTQSKRAAGGHHAAGRDTAGSGRVPAAFQGIVGMKPTRGVVSTRGVVPACRSFDCVSVFAATAAHATSVLRVMANVTHALDSAARAWPGDAPLGAPPRPSVAVPSPDLLAELSAEARAAFTAAVDRCAAIGAEIIEADIEPLVAAGSLLYGGAFVAERYAAVGRFIAAHPCDVDPTVAQIITAGAAITAADYVADAERLDSVRVLARQILHGRDALLLPTAPFQPTLDGVAADPIGVNARLGRFTTFCNLLDMCAVAVPAGTADDGHFGVSLLAPAFHDWVLADLASRMTGADDDLVTQRSDDSGVPPRSQILVVGAHLTGQPLNRQLIERGGRFVRSVRTREDYRLYALTTEPPKPGLVRTASPVDGSPGIAGEVWALPPAGLASLLEQIPQPMVLGRVTLDDGSPITGFLCEPEAIVGAKDITGHGGWLAYLGARPIRGQNA